MNFLNGFLLPGFAAVSIPIIVHLLNRQRYRIMDWAAQEYLKRALRKHQRKIKLQEWILLLLRCLAIMAIVAMLLRPVAAQSFGKDSRLRMVVVDVSASMQASKGSMSALKNAEDAISKLLEQSNQGDQFEIYVLQDKLEPLVKNTEVVNQGPILDGISSLPAKKTAMTCSLDNLAKELAPHIESKIGDRAFIEIFVFSDFQATGLDSKHISLGEPNEKISWHFHDCSIKERDNWAISDLRLDAPNVVKNGPAGIEVDVQSYSSREQKATLKLYAGKQEVGERKLIIKAREKITTSFQMTFKDSGPQFLKAVLICDGDALSLDNTRQLGVNVSEAISVILMDGDPFGAAIWRDETAVFRKVMESRGKYKVQTYKKGSDDFSTIDLTDVKLLVMANIPNPTKAFMDKVTLFVEEGGGLIITGGPNMEGSEATTFMNDILPCTLEPKIQEPKEPWKMSLTPGRHPETEALREFNFFEYNLILKMHEVKVKENARILLRAANRYPLLVTQSRGKGKVAFWASSLDFDWCQIEGPDYVQIFGILAEYVMASNLPTMISPGKNFSMIFNTFEIGDSAKWHLEGGIGQELTLTPDEKNKNKTLVEVAGKKARQNGLYDIRSRKGSILSYVGANVDSDESDLTQFPEEKILVKGNDKVTVSRNVADFNAYLGKEDSGKEAWRMLLMIALSLMCLEGFLAWKWGNPK